PYPRDQYRSDAAADHPRRERPRAVGGHPRRRAQLHHGHGPEHRGRRRGAVRSLRHGIRGLTPGHPGQDGDAAVRAVAAPPRRGAFLTPGNGRLPGPPHTQRYSYSGLPGVPWRGCLIACFVATRRSRWRRTVTRDSSKRCPASVAETGSADSRTSSETASRVSAISPLGSRVAETERSADSALSTEA